MAKFAKDNNSKMQREITLIKIFFFQISPGNLIILYQLTKFEATSYSCFSDTLITKFLSNHTQKNHLNQIHVVLSSTQNTYLN